MFFLLLLILIFHSLSHASPHRLDHLHISIRQSTNGGAAAVELWCVGKNNAEDSALQSALDWACGSGGSNCGPIQQGGPCYVATDVQRTASYAFNDYFLKNGMTQDSCNFSGTATLTSLNPSYGRCKFPSSFSVKNGSFTTGSPTSVGLGPSSADMSGGNRNADRWCWALITMRLFCALALIFLGL